MQELPAFLRRQGTGDTRTGQCHDVLQWQHVDACAGVAAGGEPLAIGTEGEGVQPQSIVGGKCEDFLPSRRISQLGRPVAA